jgi:hypothetical protein
VTTSACKHASHRINKFCNNFWRWSTVIKPITRVTVFHSAELQCCEDYFCRLFPLGFPKDKNRKNWDLGSWEVTVLCWLFCRIADGWRNCPIEEWVISAHKRRPAAPWSLRSSLLDMCWVLNGVCLLSNLLRGKKSYIPLLNNTKTEVIPFILLERLNRSPWNLVYISCHLRPSQRCTS